MLIFRMNGKSRALVKGFARLLGFDLMRKGFVQALQEQTEQRLFDAGSRWTSHSVKPEMSSFVFRNLYRSKSQLQQDLFVAFMSAYGMSSQEHEQPTMGGFFVEFGATDGVELSNTYLLEKEYGWQGIVCEPGKIWQGRLAENRNCSIDFRCVYKETGLSLIFNETKTAGLSTIDEFSASDLHTPTRVQGHKYSVATVSLNDLLSEHKAPRRVDYLSIDTEGSEYEILKSFDFSKWDVRIITVEHNYTENRELIHELLARNGFTRVLGSVSNFDDWYVAN